MRDKNDDGKGTKLTNDASAGGGRGREDGESAKYGVVRDDLEGV